MDSVNSFSQRTVKSLVVVLILFYSLKHMGFSIEASPEARVPFLLGGLNILSGFAYGLTMAVAGLAIWKESGRPEVRLMKAVGAVENLANSLALARSLSAFCAAANAKIKFNKDRYV